MLAQCNHFARIYRHAYNLLSNHGSSDIINDNNDPTEINTPYIAISPSMRMCLIEGDYRRTQNLPTMEEVTAIIPIEYNDRGFCDVVLTLRGSSRNDCLRQALSLSNTFNVSARFMLYTCQPIICFYSRMELTDGIEIYASFPLPIPHDHRAPI